MPDGTDTDLKAELAFQTYLAAGQTRIAPTSIFTSFSDQTQNVDIDFVTINSQGGREDGQDSGNERLTVSVLINSRSARDVDEEGAGQLQIQHCENVRAIVNLLRTTDLAAQLSNMIPDFTVFPGIVFKRGRNRVSGTGLFTSEVMFEFSCCPSTIG